MKKININKALQDAENKKRLAEETQEQAKKDIQDANASLKNLRRAKQLADEANAKYEEAMRLCDSDYDFSNNEYEDYEEKSKKSNNKGIIKGLAIGAAAVALFAVSFKLTKDIKTGKLKIIYNNTSLVSDNNSKERNDSYTYNYDDNVVVVNDEEYKELTTEEFEKLVSSVITRYEEAGLEVSRENIIKYVMIANIDKLSQDNRELINEIIGNQDPDEVFADADLVISAMMTYNNNYYYANGNIDGFLLPSEVIFDENEKEKLVKIEKQFARIANSNNCVEDMNALVHNLFHDLMDPESEISSLEAGSGYLTQFLIMSPIRLLFGDKLNETNADLIKYYVTYAGDEQKYIDNSLSTAYTLNINALLKECATYTLTRD